jgi:UDP-glucose:(heptosyl)LPS alpha-1,3-glucosyltransferase
VKIALVHKRLDRNGGTERDLFQTAEGLRDLGHEVHLFCSEYGVPPPSGVEAHHVPVIPLGRSFRLWSFAWSAPAIIARANCDAVIGFGRLPRQDILRSGGGTHRGFLRQLGRKSGIARRIWQSSSIYHQSVLAIEKRQFAPSGARKIVAVSEQVKRDIMFHYGVPAHKITVLYNGVDTKQFHPARRCEVRDQLRNRWKIPLDAPLVLFVGNGFRRKGLDSLLSLFESPKLDAVFLLVVGTDARLSHYRARADAIAPGRVIFVGRQDDVENYYAAADVLALLSIQEAFGNVVLEALASGLPVLANREVGATEIIRGPLAEGLVDSGKKSRVLEDKLLLLLKKAKNPGTLRLARSLAEEYSWNNHFHTLEKLLLQNCRNPPGVAN